MRGANINLRKPPPAPGADLIPELQGREKEYPVSRELLRAEAQEKKPGFDAIYGREENPLSPDAQREVIYAAKRDLYQQAARRRAISGEEGL